MMAFKFITFSFLVLWASTINCEVNSEPFVIERVEEPTERGDFTVVETNMDESMVVIVQAAIDAAYQNHPESASGRVVYIRDLFDGLYTTKWHVVENFHAVAHHRIDYIYVITTRDSTPVHYLIWSTAV